MSQWSRWLLVVAVCGSAILGEAQAADGPKARFLLDMFRPVQAGVEYETPEAADIPKCRVQIEQRKGQRGWIVIGPDGQVLRRFLNTNTDNLVDQWRYYQQGVEVYRDIDSNFNGKVDQSRWLNTGGSRWGLDTNEDGRIDTWKMISAEEASRVAVDALRQRDASLLQTVLINAADIKTLGIEPSLAARMLKSVANPADKLTKAGSLAAGTRWVRFDCSQPGLIPADDGKASVDLVVYESALALIDTAGTSGLVQIGEMVKVGAVWKLTTIPRPLSGETVQVSAGGLLLQPTASSIPTAAPGITPQVQKLLDQLRELDNTPPTATTPAVEIGRYHARRTDVLAGLAGSAGTANDRNQWGRQLIDNLAALVQSAAWPGALARLAAEETRLRKQAPASPLVPFAAYRHLLARYSHSLQAADNQTGELKAQQQWLAGLGQFIKTYPKTEDAAEALWQLGTAHEFAAQAGQARGWYTRLAREFPRTPAGMRAAGALTRLDLKGQPLALSGKELGPGAAGPTFAANTYRGKLLLVVYWATWCKPCTKELPELQVLYKQYRSRGFEIIGVNLDLDRSSVPAYIARHRVTWRQLHEPGGLDSRLARQYGILSLPTMFLVDRRGNVLNAAATLADLKTELPKLLGE